MDSMNYRLIMEDPKVLVVSDAHLGLGKQDFVRETTWFHALMDVADDYDKVIFNGDMFETWKYGNFSWSFRERAEKIQVIMNRIPGLKRFMDSDKCVVLIGNHDISLMEYVAAKEAAGEKCFKVYRTADIVNADTMVVTHIEHGNDATNDYSYAELTKKKSIVTVAIDYITNSILDYLYKKKWVKDPISVEHNITRVVFAADVVSNKTFRKYAKKLLKEHQYNHVVFGHTHIKDIKTYDAGTYINGGSQLFELTGVILENDTVRFL